MVYEDNTYKSFLATIAHFFDYLQEIRFEIAYDVAFSPMDSPLNSKAVDGQISLAKQPVPSNIGQITMAKIISQIIMIK